MKRQKVVLVMEQGKITAAYCTRKNVEICILDRDKESAEMEKVYSAPTTPSSSEEAQENKFLKWATAYEQLILGHQLHNHGVITGPKE